MVKLQSQFGNPTFPFYNDIFKSAWAELHSHSDDRWLALSFGEALLRPFTLAYDNHYTQTQNLARDARYAVVYALLIFAAITWIVRRYLLANDARNGRAGRAKFVFTSLSPAERFLLIFFTVSYIVWQVKFSTIRYTAIAELIGPALIVVLTFALFRSGIVRTGVIALSLMIIVIALNPVQHERHPWGEKFWNVQLPAIPNPEQAIVLMANTRPWGYLVPLFPHELRWLRLKSNFTEPAHTTKMQTEMRRVIDEHSGDIYLISRAHQQYYSWLEQDAQVLSQYGLSVDTQHALPIVSPYSRPGLFLLPVKKG
jgi:hypothetical protein